MCSKSHSNNEHLPNLFTPKIVVGLCFIDWVMIAAWTLLPTIAYSATSVYDTVRPYATSSLLFDSNFFRISDSAPASQNSDKSELVKQVAAGVDIDWKVNRQQLLLGANMNQNWFQNSSNLDYLGWNFSSQWNWQAGNYLSGEIGYDRSKFLGDYSQLNRDAGNLQQFPHYFANVGYLFHPRGRIGVGFFRKERLFDEASRQISNSLDDNAEFNIQYLSPDNSSVGIRTILTRGEFPNRSFKPSSVLDDGYRRFNLGLTWDWQYSAITQFDGMVGYLYQNNNHLSERDFGDAIARLNIHWQVTDKTLIDLLFKREISQANNLAATFSLLQGVEFITQWSITPKLRIKLPISYLNQEFLGDTGVENSRIVPEKNNTYKLGLHLIYHPIENISINSVFNLEKRDSNYALRSYGDQLAGINIQAVF